MVVISPSPFPLPPYLPPPPPLLSLYLHESITLCLDTVHEWSDDGVQFWWEGGEGDKGPCHAAVDTGLHPLVLLL